MECLAKDKFIANLFIANTMGFCLSLNEFCKQECFTGQHCENSQRWKIIHAKKIVVTTQV